MGRYRNLVVPLALTGIAAFFGALMNTSFLLAGSASVNPIMFTFAVGPMLAWKVAGYHGLDRYLLPRLGVPWRSPIERGQPTSSPGAPVGASTSGSPGATSGMAGANLMEGADPNRSLP